MTAAARDLSDFDGQPVTLYEFRRTTTPTNTGVPYTSYHRCTNADSDIVYGGNTYTAIAISDDGVRQRGDEVSDQLQVTLPADFYVPQLFIAAPPDDPVHLIIRRSHYGETDAFIAWVGTVVSCRRDSDIQATLACHTADTAANRGGLRLTYQRACPHALYDTQCGADPGGFVLAGTLSAVSGLTLTSTGFGAVGDGWLNGGWAEKVGADGHVVRRAITDHVGNVVTVLGTTYGFEVGDSVTAYAGCDRSADTCNVKFDNLRNFGGFPFMPSKSPFGGDPVF